MMTEEKEFPKYIDNYTLKNKLHRLVWNCFCAVLFRPFSLPCFNGWRILVLKLFGANIGKGTIVHASAKIWAPWNLETGIRTCIAPHVIVYNPGKIKLGSKSCISQYTYLCTATHDYNSPLNTLYWQPITVGNYAWIAADAFICPGITVGEGAVVGARSVVTKDVEPWTVVGGNPARKIKQRVICEKPE